MAENREDSRPVLTAESENAVEITKNESECPASTPSVSIESKLDGKELESTAGKDDISISVSGMENNLSNSHLRKSKYKSDVLKACNLHCPFVWQKDLNFNSFDDHEMDLLSAADEMYEDMGFRFRSFIVDLVLCYHNFYQRNIANSLKYLENLEKMMNKSIRKNMHDYLFNNINDALYHVIHSCRIYILEITEQKERAQQILNKIKSYDAMNDANKAGLWAIRANVYVECGYEGIKNAVFYMKKAIKLDAENPYWHFMKGMFMGRLRRIECGITMPDNEEFEALRIAIDKRRDPAFIAFTAEVYQETAKIAKKLYVINVKNYDKKTEVELSRKLNQLNEVANQYFKDCIELKPNSSHLLFRCGKGLINLPPPYQDAKLGSSYIRKGLEISPNSSYGNHAMAMYYEKIKKDPERAKTYLDVSASRKNFHAHVDLIRMEFFKSRNAEELRKNLENLLILFSELPKKRKILGEIVCFYLFVDYDLVEACFYMRQLIRLNSKEVDVFNNFKTMVLPLNAPIPLSDLILNRIKCLKLEDQSDMSREVFRKYVHYLIEEDVTPNRISNTVFDKLNNQLERGFKNKALKTFSEKNPYKRVHEAYEFDADPCVDSKPQYLECYRNDLTENQTMTDQLMTTIQKSQTKYLRARSDALRSRDLKKPDADRHQTHEHRKAENDERDQRSSRKSRASHVHRRRRTSMSSASSPSTSSSSAEDRHTKHRRHRRRDRSTTSSSSTRSSSSSDDYKGKSRRHRRDRSSSSSSSKDRLRSPRRHRRHRSSSTSSSSSYDDYRKSRKSHRRYRHSKSTSSSASVSDDVLSKRISRKDNDVRRRSASDDYRRDHKKSKKHRSSSSSSGTESSFSNRSAHENKRQEEKTKDGRRKVKTDAQTEGKTDDSSRRSASIDRRRDHGKSEKRRSSTSSSDGELSSSKRSTSRPRHEKKRQEKKTIDDRRKVKTQEQTTSKCDEVSKGAEIKSEDDQSTTAAWERLEATLQNLVVSDHSSRQDLRSHRRKGKSDDVSDHGSVRTVSSRRTAERSSCSPHNERKHRKNPDGVDDTPAVSSRLSSKRSTPPMRHRVVPRQDPSLESDRSIASSSSKKRSISSHRKHRRDRKRDVSADSSRSSARYSSKHETKYRARREYSGQNSDDRDEKMETDEKVSKGVAKKSSKLPYKDQKHRRHERDTDIDDSSASASGQKS